MRRLRLRCCFAALALRRRLRRRAAGSRVPPPLGPSLTGATLWASRRIM